MERTRPEFSKEDRMEVTKDQLLYDLNKWWADTEGKCIRAGNLNKVLALDRQRVLRRMSTLPQDILYWMSIN